MTRSLAPLPATLAVALSLAACTPPPGGSIPAPTPDPGATTLIPFGSEAELAAFTGPLAREIRRQERYERHGPPPPPPPPPPPGTESITSVQHEGVDEGGIVKVHGDHLVVLRRGRLFTIRIGGDELRPVAAVDAFGPGIDPEASWYDEMLVSGDNVVVIGYSYDRGGTELGIFRIGGDGSLAHRATYQLRAADYYSARNYASRLIGTRSSSTRPFPWAATCRRACPPFAGTGPGDGCPRPRRTASTTPPASCPRRRAWCCTR
jgi:Beta propeller domain